MELVRRFCRSPAHRTAASSTTHSTQKYYFSNKFVNYSTPPKTAFYAHRISIEQEMGFGFFTVFRFLIELEILFLEQDFGFEQDFRPQILLETEILDEEQDFELKQETKYGEKTEIHFLLDRNPVSKGV